MLIRARPIEFLVVHNTIHIMATMTMAPSTIHSDRSKVVHSTLNYWLDPALGGHTHYRTGTAGYYRNRKFDEHEVEIYDARGREDKISLDIHGFTHYKHTSAEKDFVDDERVKAIVYPETEALIKEVYV